MPKSCCVAGCTVNSVKNKGLKFYVLPLSGVRREKWLRAINRCELKPDGSINPGKLWEPKSNFTYVCGRHFISGEKSSDQTHPDYVPSIFPTMSNSSNILSRSESKMSRFNRKNERTQRKATKKKSPRKRQKLDLPLIDQDEDLTRDGGPASEDNDNPDCLLLGTLGNEDNSLHVGPEENLSAPADCTDPDCTVKSPFSPMQEPLSSSEREQWNMELDNLRRERDEALAKIEAMEKLVRPNTLSSTAVEGNDQKCMHLTGLKWDVFMELFTFVSSFIGGNRLKKGSVSLREQLFLTLVKLPHNVAFEFLSVVTGTPKTTCIDHFWKWIDLLHGKVGFLVKWPDRDNIFQIIPPVFREKFPRLTCIVDCFEIFIDAPKNLLARALCYSNYKKHCTIKVFVGCNPLGMVTYLSQAWGGRASDVQIVRDSGFIDSKFHHPGDQILADRGFTLSEDFATKCSCELITPAFRGKKGRKQLSAWEVEKSRKISSVRIHIERVIGLMKTRFNILKGPMPIKCVQRLKDESLGATLASCDKIITVCAALTNMGESIVYKE